MSGMLSQVAPAPADKDVKRQIAVTPEWRGYVSNPAEKGVDRVYTRMLLARVCTFAKHSFTLRKTLICHVFSLCFGHMV